MRMSGIVRHVTVFPFLLVLLVCLLAATASLAESEDGGRGLTFGYIDWYPYQYHDVVQADSVPSGLDVELVREIGRQAGHSVDFHFDSWEDVLKGLQDGTIDIAVGSRDLLRDNKVYYSLPYRKSRDAVYARSAIAAEYQQTGVQELLQRMQGGFRLGVVNGYIYSPELESYLKTPENSPFIYTFVSDSACLRNLKAQAIDGCLVDDRLGATLVWEHRWQEKIVKLPAVLSEYQLYILFSRKTMNQVEVDGFNRSIKELQASGQWSRLILDHLHPIIISLTTEAKWFLIVDYLGTIAFAISGLIIAYRERFSFFGALILASLPAIGGGALRDIVIGRYPVGFMRSPVYGLLILATVVIGLCIIRVWKYLEVRYGSDHLKIQNLQARARLTVELFDAIGLASFTITGVTVALANNLHPLWLWGTVLGCTTAAGGGIIRDVVRGDLEKSSLKTAFYPEIALFWGGVFSIYLTVLGEHVTADLIHGSVVFTMISALMSRMYVYYKGWNAPLYR